MDLFPKVGGEGRGLYVVLRERSTCVVHTSPSSRVASVPGIPDSPTSPGSHPRQWYPKSATSGGSGPVGGTGVASLVDLWPVPESARHGVRLL